MPSSRWVAAFSIGVAECISDGGTMRVADPTVAVRPALDRQSEMGPGSSSALLPGRTSRSIHLRPTVFESRQPETGPAERLRGWKRLMVLAFDARGDHRNPITIWGEPMIKSIVKSALVASLAAGGVIALTAVPASAAKITITAGAGSSVSCSTNATAKLAPALKNDWVAAPGDSVPPVAGLPGTRIRVGRASHHVRQGNRDLHGHRHGWHQLGAHHRRQEADGRDRSRSPGHHGGSNLLLARRRWKYRLVQHDHPVDQWQR